MSNSWKIFLTIEAVLFVWLLYQLFTNTFLLFLVAGGLLLIFSNRFSVFGESRLSFFIGAALLVFALLSTNAIWIMLVIAVIFFSRKLYAVFVGESGAFFSDIPWKEKQFVTLHAEDKQRPFEVKRAFPWIGGQTIGEHIYEWEDINFSQFAGDTIIDLENTILQKGQNVVLIRKGLGKTRVLVPEGIGIFVDHSALSGRLLVGEDTMDLKNENIKWKSKDYHDQTRKLKLVTNVLVGDVEVIRV